ncbi:glycine cleavage system protein H [Lacicoccus alkaliphilus]|uniref:Glycine cleavage system H protein (Lipoate-binding) n=1 Tax=Lacicoccus alkaliphilus DSM 16010 TaxID=1123231 RepID=A0A1M7CA46_9BACL|nr:glycine cleavage system protein H [Salinicoccus alkaliphilus]SHL64053.1 Glycine cleavage system H protein (lipoate-binding) [Salinicoccus alkaliphilus DSM 16010]
MRKVANYLWVEKNGEEYKLIMTPELQDDIGTVGFVEFTKEKTLKKDDSVLELEGSKTVLDLTAPIGGKIVAVNEKAEDAPELLNSADPDESWVVKLAEVDEAEFNALENA